MTATRISIRNYLPSSCGYDLPGPEAHSMPRLTSMKDQRFIGAASRTGSADKVYTLIEYSRTPATMVDTKPTMNAASTEYLSLLVVFLRDQSSGNGNAKISMSDATVNAFVAVDLIRQVLALGEHNVSWFLLTVKEYGNVNASPR
jgi:hypothetical protein